MTATVTRRRRLRRSRFGKPTFEFQERDRAIVQLVADYGIVSSEIVRALIPGSDQAILRRLQCLYHAGYLDRPRHQHHIGNSPMIYALGAKGAEAPGIRHGHRGRDWSEKNRRMQVGYLEHQLMISRFRAVLVLAGKQKDVEVESWRQGTEIWDSVEVDRGEHSERIPVAPDAAFTLRLLDEPEGKNRIHCFLEADRSTMTAKRFFRKLEGYWWHWRSGRLQERFGVRNTLVVTVTKTVERAENLTVVAGAIDAPQHRGLRMFLFGSEQGLSLKAPGEILNLYWFSPADRGKHSLTE
jgi:hypothetical protein